MKLSSKFVSLTRFSWTRLTCAREKSLTQPLQRFESTILRPPLTKSNSIIRKFLSVRFWIKMVSASIDASRSIANFWKKRSKSTSTTQELVRFLTKWRLRWRWKEQTHSLETFSEKKVRTSTEWKAFWPFRALTRSMYSTASACWLPALHTYFGKKARKESAFLSSSASILSKSGWKTNSKRQLWTSWSMSRRSRTRLSRNSSASKIIDENCMLDVWAIYDVKYWILMKLSGLGRRSKEKVWKYSLICWSLPQIFHRI